MNFPLNLNIYSFNFLLYVSIFLLLNFIFLKIFFKFSISKKLLDIPNKRSSHIKATPKGAGIVFSLTSIIFIILIFKVNHILILMPLLIISFIDDFKPLNSLSRILVHFFTSTLIVLNSNLFEKLTFSNGFIESTIIFVFLVIASTAIINFFNFSDGIDGIVASSASIYLIFIGLILSPIFLIIGLSLIIFLIFNWSPAKLFMGDVGSTFIGSIVSIAFLTQNNFLSSFSLLLMISPILMDPFFCVIRRLLNKQNIFIAHKSHLYQRLHQGGWKHSDISLLFSAATFILCSSFIFLGRPYGILAVFLTFFIGIYLEIRHAVPFINSDFQKSSLK